MAEEGSLPKDGLLQRMPVLVLGAAAQAYEPGTRAASAPGPQPPGQRSQPRCWCRSGSPATEPSGPGAKLDPPEHTQPITAPGGERWPIFRAAGLADHRSPTAALVLITANQKQQQARRLLSVRSNPTAGITPTTATGHPLSSPEWTRSRQDFVAEAGAPRTSAGSWELFFAT
jgi:hypothetical protein